MSSPIDGHCPTQRDAGLEEGGASVNDSASVGLDRGTRPCFGKI
jgi:hypothetical protein